jgi:Soluble lytic murein transglycosylase and related regulatory proteins (some contain LysM/invasin domains)
MKTSVVLLGILCSFQTACGADLIIRDSGADVLATDAAIDVLAENPKVEDVVHLEIPPNKYITESRSWRAPDYSGQSKALGYKGDAFAIPKGMEHQVGFWVDVYTKYSTDEAVIHDSEYIDLVYEVVDIKGLPTERAKQKKVDAVKKEIQASLLKLAELKAPTMLTEREQRIWDYFAKVNEENKFKDAADMGRIRFQLGQKDRMFEAIFYSGRYIEDMEKIFRDAGLPIELTRLAFVESSFNVMARSKVGASGLWQIMPYTARPYKMISKTVDKRNHPIEATKFAARLLRTNYGMLDSWPLAVTGYNHGPTGVRKMTESYGSRDLAHLVENVKSRKSFGFASRNFYASFLAALEVERNAATYFPRVVWSKTLEAQDIKLPQAIKYRQILTWFEGDDDRAQVFNPHLTQLVRKGREIPANTTIAVPKDKYSGVLIALTKKNRAVANVDKKSDLKN